MTTTAISVLSDDKLAKTEEAEHALEAVLAVCNVANLSTMSVLRQSVELAQGLKRLDSILTEQVVKAIFMPLQGSRLGFLTDKDKTGGYEWNEVRDALKEGMIRGLRPVGNEINIIAGNCYAAVNGVERLVLQFPGLTDLWLTPGVPQKVGDKGAFVPFHAQWILNGQPMEMHRDVVKRDDGTMDDTRICVKVNSGMGDDAIIGKARRKMLFAIYQRITNSSFALRDADEAIDAIGVPVQSTPQIATVAPEAEGKRMKLGAKPANHEPLPDPEDDGR